MGMRPLSICLALLSVALLSVSCAESEFNKSEIARACRKKYKLADNSACYVCHLNYSRNTFAIVHSRRGVGCAKCHGESEDHCGDEDHRTPPEKMYPKDKIDKACAKCHKEEKMKKVKDHKAYYENPGSKLCNDCHGKKHRLAKRKVRWNKVTRELIEYE
jgi:hypothetical protein